MLDLNKQSATLIIIDVQENLFKVIENNNILSESINKLIKCINILGLPVLITEQFHRLLGSTIDPVTELLPSTQPLQKMTFNCYLDQGFRETLKETNKKHIIIAGIETHICILQTALALKNNGYKVYVVSDACGARKIFDHKTALEFMQNNDINIVTYEMVVFQLLRSAEDDKYKNILKIINN